MNMHKGNLQLTGVDLNPTVEEVMGEKGKMEQETLAFLFPIPGICGSGGIIVQENVLMKPCSPIQ
jgi:hypothetical protein